MASWKAAYWEGGEASGLSRHDRASGHYRRYVPDRLMEAPLQMSGELAIKIAKAEQAVRSISGDTRDLAGVARFLLRSEAIASSRIEGIAPSVKHIAFAELGEFEKTPRVNELARLVANNMGAVEASRTELVHSPAVSVEQIVQLHSKLLADQPRLHGLRTVQNWIGGSPYTPIGAVFVPPAPELVEPLMEDLSAYLNGAAHSAIVQAALVHAQFETIHPFADGNGRVGRALIQTVLTRRGLTPAAVLPVSMVLSTLRDTYLGGLTSYRHVAEPGTDAYFAAQAAWINVFVDAVHQAAIEAKHLSQELQRLRQQWDERYEEWRAAQGFSRSLRTGSATALILESLPATPILSVRTVMRIHDASKQAATSALNDLHECGIVTAIGGGRTTFYQATDVIDLVTYTERKLASTQFDTRLSPPNRPVPARPQP